MADKSGLTASDCLAHGMDVGINATDVYANSVGRIGRIYGNCCRMRHDFRDRCRRYSNR